MNQLDLISSSFAPLPEIKSLYEYKFIKVLGMGSSGLVCRYNRDGSDYAAKFISTHTTDPLTFQREIDVLYRLNNYDLAIPKIYSHGCIMGYDIISSLDDLLSDAEHYTVVSPRGTQHQIDPYRDYYVIVLEFIDGMDLSTYVRRQYIDDRSAYNIACWLFDLLTVLHEHEIVHRDIKPGNIVITEDQRLYLVDFGFACSYQDPTLFCTDGRVGTAVTLSPEIWQHKITERNLYAADVWAMGATLFFVLNQKYPWEGNTKTSLEYKIINEKTPDGRYLYPVTDVITLALTKSPAVRPSARKLHDCLRTYPVN